MHTSSYKRTMLWWRTRIKVCELKDIHAAHMHKCWFRLILRNTLLILKEMTVVLWFDWVLNWRRALFAEVNITGNQTDVRTTTSHLLEVNLKTIKEHRTGDVLPAPKLSRQHLWLPGMWTSAHQSTAICQDCVSSDIYSNTTGQKISLHLLPSTKEHPHHLKINIKR